MKAGNWIAPWLEYQHEERYAFAAKHVTGKHVLDAACGTGYGARILARAGARRVAAVDIALDALAAWDSADADRTCGSVFALPFRAASFDVFVSLETIEHVEDDVAFAAEARRVLKEDGVLICSTPNREVLNPGRRITDRPFNPFHVREYSIEELDRVLRTSFSEIRFYGQAPFSSSYVRVLAKIGRRLPMLAVRAHQVRKVLGAPLETRARHAPAPLPFNGAEPEILVAVCSGRSMPPS